MPKRPEEILGLKVCEPAMGSGSFLVAALRYLVDALARSLHHYGMIRADGEVGAVDHAAVRHARPGEGARGAATAAARGRALRRAPASGARAPHRRALPLRRRPQPDGRGAGPALAVGRDAGPRAAVRVPRPQAQGRQQPRRLLAAPRRGLPDQGAGPRGRRRQDQRRHEVAQGGASRTPRLSSRTTSARSAARPHSSTTSAIHPADLVGTLRQRFAALHDLPRDAREDAYRALLASDEYLRSATPWTPGARCGSGPRATTTCRCRATGARLDDAAADAVAAVARRAALLPLGARVPRRLRCRTVRLRRRPRQPAVGDRQAQVSGVLLAPRPAVPDVRQDRTRSRSSGELFDEQDGLGAEWLDVPGRRSRRCRTSSSTRPSRSTSSLPGRGARLAGVGGDSRPPQRRHSPPRPSVSAPGLGRPQHLQAVPRAGPRTSASTAGRHRDAGPVGRLHRQGDDRAAQAVPRIAAVGVALRLREPRSKLFPIHSSFKFAPIVVQPAGRPRARQGGVHAPRRRASGSVRTSMRSRSRSPTSSASAPATWSFMELKDDRDLEIVERIYADHELLGAYCSRRGRQLLRSEFNMTSASKHFTPRSKLPEWPDRAGRGHARSARPRAAARGWVRAAVRGQVVLAARPVRARQGTEATASASSCASRRSNAELAH